MSKIVTVKVFDVAIPVNIIVDHISNEDINTIEKSLVNCIQEKFNKLRLYLVNLNTTYINGMIVINDEYKIHRDLKEILSAFGLIVSEISLGLQGNTYIVKDNILEILNHIIDISKLNLVSSNFALTNNQIIQLNAHQYTKNQVLFDYLSEIIRTGKITVEGKVIKEVTEVKVNGRISSRNEQIKEDNGIEVKKQISTILDSFKNKVNSELNKYNNDMVQGTRQIITSRAKSMGYGVKEIKKGTITQMVLVKLG